MTTLGGRADNPREPRPSGRTRVLWITDEPPDRHLGGGNIRQAMLLDHLRHRLEVTVVLAGHLEDDLTRRHVREVLELPAPPRRANPNRTPRRIRELWRALARRPPSEVVGAARVRSVLRPVVRRLGDDFDVIVVHHLHLSGIVRARRRAAWLLHLFDVASVRRRDELAVEPGRRQRWLLARDSAKAQRLEQRMATAYDGIVVVSEEDADAVRGGSRDPAEGRAVVVPNGVDVSRFANAPLPKEPRLVLPASLNYRPNVLGALWFCNEVWPRVRSAVPDARFDVVGRQPVDEVLELGRRPGIEVHPDVPQMAPWLKRARVVVVPLRIGSGTRLKALEAMAAGRPVVGTTIGLQGLGFVDRVHARVTDHAPAMADAIVELLTSDTAAVSLVAASRRLVEERFGWERLAVRFAAAIEAARAGEAVRDDANGDCHNSPNVAT